MSVLQAAMHTRPIRFTEVGNALKEGSSIRQALSRQFNQAFARASQAVNDAYLPVRDELRSQVETLLGKLGLRADEYFFREAPVSIHSPSQRLLRRKFGIRSLGQLFAKGHHTTVSVVKHPSPQQLADDTRETVLKSRKKPSATEKNLLSINNFLFKGDKAFPNIKLESINGTEVLTRKFQAFGLQQENWLLPLDETTSVSVARTVLFPEARKLYDSVIGLLDSVKTVLEKVKPEWVQSALKKLEPVWQGQSLAKPVLNRKQAS